MSNEKEIAKKLKMLRVEHGLTQTEVAEKIGISQQRYSTYESKNTSIDSDIIIRICKFYGISADYLLGLNNTKKQESGVTNITNEEIDSIVERVVSIVKKG